LRSWCRDSSCARRWVWPINRSRVPRRRRRLFL
jgi:hypothetical protein